ncbi:universal stress protein [Luteimonas saliphila]|uniref:universal stress protein n=1 Tax=Luteimonas saliphila TaxID=2804919 RepID=UPI00192D9B42|nr:universal stress protein [Luteimonas saliphila]
MSHIRGILLATDLGARCDRATERALRLARQFGGPALAATVVEPSAQLARRVPRYELPSWYREPAPLLQAERRLRRDLDGGAQPWEVWVGEGRAGEQVAGLLDAMPADTLLLTGPVREGVLGPTALGSTVDRLLRRECAALLMVRARVHADYRHLLVASDFSAPSAQALRRARALFPAARITVLHGVTVPMLGLLDSTRDEAVAQALAEARSQGETFLGEAGFEGAELLVEYGDAARLAQQYLETFAADLVVLGTHGHGALYELVVGSVARRLLATLDADTLVVRG